MHKWFLLLSLYSNNVHFLVIILYPSYARCYLWGNLGKGYMKPLPLFFFFQFPMKLYFKIKKKFFKKV